MNANCHYTILGKRCAYVETDSYCGCLLISFHNYTRVLMIHLFASVEIVHPFFILFFFPKRMIRSSSRTVWEPTKHYIIQKPCREKDVVSMNHNVGDAPEIWPMSRNTNFQMH